MPSKYQEIYKGEIEPSHTHFFVGKG